MAAQVDDGNRLLDDGGSPASSFLAFNKGQESHKPTRLSQCRTERMCSRVVSARNQSEGRSVAERDCIFEVLAWPARHGPQGRYSGSRYVVGGSRIIQVRA